MAAWIYDDFGRIVCGTHRDETTGAQARHGDRAIAYMLALKGLDHAYALIPEDPDPYPPNSMGKLLGHAEVWARTQTGESQQALHEMLYGIDPEDAYYRAVLQSLSDDDPYHAATMKYMRESGRF